MRTKSILPIVIFITCFSLTNLSAQFWSQTGGGGNVTTYPTLTNSNVAIGIASATTNRLWVLGNGRFQTSTAGNSGYIDLQSNNGVSPLTDAPASIEIGAATDVSQIDFKGYPNTNADFSGKIKYTEGSGFAFQTDGIGTDRMVITENGYVGIGIVPSTFVQFQVEGIISKFSSGNANIVLVPGGGTVELTGPSTATAIDFRGNGHIGSDYWGRVLYTDGSGFSFLTGGNATPKVFVRETDGWMGIGTVSPSAKLHVAGNVVVNNNVGIGTTTPATALHVVGTTRISTLAGTGNRMVICDANGTLAFQSIPSGGNDNLGNHTATTDLNMNSWDIGNVSRLLFIQGNEFNENSLGIWSTGRLGVNGQPQFASTLDVQGDAYCTSGSWTGSDLRFKKDVEDLTSSLDKILKLRGTSYYFRSDEFKELNFDTRKHIGFIAQELEEVFPEMVKTGANGYKGVSYDMMIPVLVEGIKEQQSIIEEQNKKIDQQEQRLQLLESANNSKSQFDNSDSRLSSEAILYQNNPNPFDDKTQIKCFIPARTSNAQLKFYDLSGNLIQTITVSGSGEQMISISGQEYSSTIYVYSLYVNDVLVDSKKMVVAK